jgi:hypothetical protein
MLMVVPFFFKKKTAAPSDMIITRCYTASTNRSRGRAARDERKLVRWPKRGQGQLEEYIEEQVFRAVLE